MCSGVSRRWDAGGGWSSISLNTQSYKLHIHSSMCRNVKILWLWPSPLLCSVPCVFHMCSGVGRRSDAGGGCSPISLKIQHYKLHIHWWMCRNVRTLWLWPSPLLCSVPCVFHMCSGVGRRWDAGGGCSPISLKIQYYKLHIHWWICRNVKILWLWPSPLRCSVPCVFHMCSGVGGRSGAAGGWSPVSMITE